MTKRTAYGFIKNLRAGADIKDFVKKMKEYAFVKKINEENK